MQIDALQAELRDIGHIGSDKIYCLRDIVGYGAAPVECVQLVRDHCSVTIKGDHDELVGQQALSHTGSV